MVVPQKVGIGLTQFIDFTIKGSTAKTNMVRQIKYQSDYNPAFDYWKQLRDGIIKYHESNLNLDFFDQLLAQIDDKKKKNYTHAIKQYKKFLKNKDISWFNPGKSTWISNELIVRSSPELGLIIDGEPHLIKLYFKGKSEKVDKRNTSTTLALLTTSSYEENYDSIVNRSVLNLDKVKLYSNSNITEDQLIALESEASQFMYIWKKI
ncbi:hypothetical protein KQ939_09935 [Planococcus sp. CP5-4]|uniref:hypothetical protein n=1 Tax=unclassified Planococcus (in: firmicutes) TaxID=2662419 RepID=UPI001C245D8A|nr:MULTISPECIES: hypothetical protein [unclassified Planococcus (in: firmicutes)]MBU9673857.1 hypothetical protein [Planococcus sp. CP5-4_YE]MBV0908985.1 hypothetical protein [Planococcus sp. CP5-4_UN]MBW6064034.1 hypothetical protein [Planococcus sp. CP5-4]